MLQQLGEAERTEFLEVCNGERIPSLMSDVIAKKLFNPETHPEWVDFIFREIMKEEISSEGSFNCEGQLLSSTSKKMFFDDPVKLSDGRTGNLEFQVNAQEMFLTRGELYGSTMLLLQYGVEKGKPKNSVYYENVKGVVLIFLLRDSPGKLKAFESEHYIHRFKEFTADSGLSFLPLVTTVYVQVDKASSQFLEGKDGENNPRLQKFLAMLYDANEEKTEDEISKDGMLSAIVHEAVAFVQDKEVQKMILAEEFAMMDYNSSMYHNRLEGRAEGKRIALIKQTCRKLSRGIPVNEIATALEAEPDEIAAICEAAKKFAPDYDAEKIFEAMNTVEKTVLAS